MSVHVCKCQHKGKEEYHLRYPGMGEEAAQVMADGINAGRLKTDGINWRDELIELAEAVRVFRISPFLTGLAGLLGSQAYKDLDAQWNHVCNLLKVPPRPNKVNTSMLKSVITLTGPTCSGKTTVERILAECPSFGRVISHTTRAPREGEVDGVDYYFVNRSFFNDTGFVEQVGFNGHLYGIHSSTLFNLASDGYSNLLIVAEPNGVCQVSNWCRDHGVKHYPVFLKQSAAVRYERFLRRFAEEKTSNAFKTAAARLSVMASEEAWIDWPGINYLIVECGQASPEETAELVMERLSEAAVKL